MCALLRGISAETAWTVGTRQSVVQDKCGRQPSQFLSHLTQLSLPPHVAATGGWRRQLVSG